MVMKKPLPGNKAEQTIQVGGYVDLNTFFTIEECKARAGRSLQTKLTMGEFVVMALNDLCEKYKSNHSGRSKTKAPDEHPEAENTSV